MTSGGHPFPTTTALAAWSRSLPSPQRLWVGTLRIWQVEVARITPQATITHLLQQAANVAGVDSTTLAERVGVTAPHTESPRMQPRSTMNFLPLDVGVQRIDLKGLFLPAWPTPLAASDVPAALCEPQTTGGMAFQPDDWQTVPVVRALTFIGTAAQLDDGIHVYPFKPSAGTIVTESLFTLPTTAFAVATPDDWAAAWHTWCDDQRITTGPPPTIRQGHAHIDPQHPAHDYFRRLPALRHREAWLLAGSGPWYETAGLIHAE